MGLYLEGGGGGALIIGRIFASEIFFFWGGGGYFREGLIFGGTYRNFTVFQIHDFEKLIKAIL